MALFLIIGVGRMVARPSMGDELLFVALTLGLGAYGVALLLLGRWFGRKDIPHIEAGLTAALRPESTDA